MVPSSLASGSVEHLADRARRRRRPGPGPTRERGRAPPAPAARPSRSGPSFGDHLVGERSRPCRVTLVGPIDDAASVASIHPSCLPACWKRRAASSAQSAAVRSGVQRPGLVAAARDAHRAAVVRLGQEARPPKVVGHLGRRGCTTGSPDEREGGAPVEIGSHRLGHRPVDRRPGRCRVRTGSGRSRPPAGRRRRRGRRSIEHVAGRLAEHGGEARCRRADRRARRRRRASGGWARTAGEPLADRGTDAGRDRVEGLDAARWPRRRASSSTKSVLPPERAWMRSTTAGDAAVAVARRPRGARPRHGSAPGPRSRRPAPAISPKRTSRSASAHRSWSASCRSRATGRPPPPW